MISQPVIRLSQRSILTYSPCALKDAGLHKQLPEDAWNFLSCLVDEDATHAVTAYAEGVLIGWFRFTIRRGTLHAQGTWVAKSHRRQGIGKALWRHALRRTKPRRVEVLTVSRGGTALLSSLRRDLPDDRSAFCVETM